MKPQNYSVAGLTPAEGRLLTAQFLLELLAYPALLYVRVQTGCTSTQGTSIIAGQSLSERLCNHDSCMQFATRHDLPAQPVSASRATTPAVTTQLRPVPDMRACMAGLAGDDGAN